MLNLQGGGGKCPVAPPLAAPLSLTDILKDKKPLPGSLVRWYLMQLLEGIDFLHQRNIFHSDIKPANILLTSEDNIKICDFGIVVGN